ncbi:hypothetical protein M3Y99_01898300 [Aphelenchoides fujianensis]|nr:hypothetical protein M3Y99_01898300 [Aphelenchoides fujianensis]
MKSNRKPPVAFDKTLRIGVHDQAGTLLLRSAEVIEWPFETREEYALVADLRIGSPRQTVNVSLALYSFGLAAMNSPLFHSFDQSASSTFDQTDVIYDATGQIGVIGDDVLSIGKKTFQTPVFLTIWTADRLENGWPVNNVLGFSRPPGGSSTIDGLLEELDEREVVFAHDLVCLDADSYSFAGYVTLGGRSNDRCGEQWTLVPNAATDGSWMVTVDKFSFADSSFSTPTPAYISWGSYLTLPERHRAAIVQVFGDAFASLPCESPIEFAFAIGGLELRLKAADYLLLMSDGTSCELQVQFTTDEQFGLSAALFKQYCLLLDYSAEQVGFSPLKRSTTCSKPTPLPSPTTPKGSSTITPAFFLLSLAFFCGDW